MKKGFTLIELIVVLVIIGFLAAIAIPRFVDLTGQAKTASEKGAVGAIRAGIALKFGYDKKWPTKLDSATTKGECDATKKCFEEVAEPVIEARSSGGWCVCTIAAPFEYRGPDGGCYSYTDAAGTTQGRFIKGACTNCTADCGP